MSKMLEHMHCLNPNDRQRYAEALELVADDIAQMYVSQLDHMMYTKSTGDILEVVVILKDGGVLTCDAPWFTIDGCKEYPSIEALERNITIDRIVQVW